MKQLVLVRHGKSSWEYDLPDDERPLKKRAFNDANLVIKALRNNPFLDNSFNMWSSYAVRALTTARIFQEQLEVSNENFEIKEDLYTFDRNHLLNAISNCDDTIQNLMIFGHNPALTSVANVLGDEQFTNIPTTGLVLIKFESDSWNNLKDGKTIIYLFPKNLR